VGIVRDMSSAELPPPLPPAGQTPAIDARTNWPIGVATALRILWILSASLWGLAIIAFYNRITVLNDFKSDPLATGALSKIDGADSLAQFTVGLAVIVGVATIVLQMIWLFRTTKTLRSLGTSTRRSPGWAIGGFFIPIAQFFIIHRMYADCRSALISRGISVRRYSLLSVWWFLQAAAIIVARAAANSAQDDVDQFITHDYTLIGASAAFVAAGVMAAIVFGRFRDDYRVTI